MRIVKLILLTLLCIPSYSIYSNNYNKYELNRPAGIAIYTTLIVATTGCIGSAFYFAETKKQNQLNTTKK